MSLARDPAARSTALLGLHEALGALEDDLPSLLRQASITTGQYLGDAAGIWLLREGVLRSETFLRGDADVLDAMAALCDPGCLAPTGFLGRVAQDGGPARLTASEMRELVAPGQREVFDRLGTGGMAVVPLVCRGARLGCLAVVRDSHRDPFDDDAEDVLVKVARIVSLTISNAQLLADATKARQRAAMLAREDVLTGLLNRRGFLEVLRETPLDQAALVAVLDMDGFRLVNDGFGHAAGDMVLTSLAARLCASVPPQAPVARIGGDEFAFLIVAEDEERAADLVEHAVQACTGTLTIVGLGVPVTVSVGTAVPEPSHADDALQQADLAMARAKRRGGVITAYDPALDDPATRRLRDVLDLRRAILGDDLVVHYQPVVPVGSGPLRVEALVRRLVGGQLQGPASWLGTAGRAGLMPELTANVLRQVVQQLVSWWQSGLEVECAVNVPAPVLATPDLIRDLLVTLDRADLPRRALSVEVTEGDLVGPQARAALARCADADISVAVDDFGTGWSALSYLVDLPLRTVKLDKSFVDGVDLDSRRAAVVRAVVAVAHELGLGVVAEGVETQEVADVVIDLGADALQGYLYGRPTSADRLEPLLRGGLSAGRR